MTFLINWLLTSIAVALADWIVPGIFVVGPVQPWICYAVTALFLSLVNSLIKPIMSLIALPLTFITFGLFQLVVNGLMLELASSLALNLTGTGIAITGFGAAFSGAIIVSIASTVLGIKR